MATRKALFYPDMRLTAHALRNRQGSTYLALMFLIVIMAISVTVVAKQWKTVVQREKEADLLWRGIEIQTAIQFFYNEKPLGTSVARAKYPLTLEELTKPPKPFLRRVYKDPITGGDWQYIPDPATGGIRGVRSASTLAPIKQHQFPAAVAHFEGFDKYNQWVFLYPSASTPQAEQAMVQQIPGTLPGPPGSVPPGFPTQQNTGTAPGPPGSVPQGFPPPGNSAQ